MPTYRPLLIGPKRVIAEARDLECSTDEEAMVEAKALVDGHDIEVWNKGQFVAFFASMDRKLS